MKRSIVWTLAGLFIFTLVGCAGGDDAKEPAKQKKSKAQKKKEKISMSAPADLGPSADRFTHVAVS